MAHPDAGELRKRITIQQRSGSTQDGFGSPITTWGTYATVWAAVRPLSGRELIAAQAVQSEISHQVTLRYRSGITTAMRVLFGSRIFNITAVLDENEAHEKITLLCTEGLNEVEV